jgi:hypothetical protein
MSPRTRATLEDLYRVPENGKAELVNGEIVLMPPAGGIPGRSGGRIYISLDEYERRTGRGYAFPDNVGFVVDLPRRSSFSPDAAFHPGPLQGGRFLNGATHSVRPWRIANLGSSYSFHRNPFQRSGARQKTSEADGRACRKARCAGARPEKRRE